MKAFIIYILLLLGLPSWAQTYISEKGSISFFSEAPLENIKATNEEVTSLFDLATGEIAFSVPIRSFKFRKSLMQKHFNENYMDSDQYPKANFTGKIRNYQPRTGSYRAIAEGQMTIRGKTNKIEVTGDLLISDQGVEIRAAFPVALEDYKIKIPKILFSNIADTVDVDVTFQYKPYVKN